MRWSWPSVPPRRSLATEPGAERCATQHIGQMVLAHNGTIDALINNVFNYPTLAECYKVAALAAANKLAAMEPACASVAVS